MTWNVYIADLNGRQVEVWDIFRCYAFKEAVDKAIKKNNNKEEFAEELRDLAMYYFWKRCEYEITLAPHIGKGHEMKVDVYNQLTLNWDCFVDYVWGNKQ